MDSNFAQFVDNFKTSNPTSGFERKVITIAEDIKNAIVGVKESLVSPQKVSQTGTAAHSIKEIETKQALEVDASQEVFGNIQKILNDIEYNTSKSNLPVPYKANTNVKDNFSFSPVSVDIQGDPKNIIDLEKKSFLIQREQLAIVKEIRDFLKPKVPGELTEQKAAPLDFLALDDTPKMSVPLPEFSSKKGAVIIGDSKTKPKTTIGQKIGTAAKVGMGVAGVAGLAKFTYDTAKQYNAEILAKKLEPIQMALDSGEITSEEADVKIKEITEIHEKEMVKAITDGAGSVGGALAGGWAGAKVGAIFGPAGTVGGGIIGSVAGSMIGPDAVKKGIDYYKENNVDQMIDDAKEKAVEVYDHAKEKLSAAKEYIQTELIPEGSKKISSFIDSIKNGTVIDDAKKFVSDKVDAVKKDAQEKLDQIEGVVNPKNQSSISPETMSPTSKMLGDQPGKYLSNMSKALEEKVGEAVDTGKTLINNVVNNQSTNNYIPLKGTPRAEYNGSALDRYTDRLSMF